jgi:putative transposase
MIEREGSEFSIREQCNLLSINRSGLYYTSHGFSEKKQKTLNRLDELYTENPVWGGNLFSAVLRREGFSASPSTVRRYMCILGLQSQAPGPHTSTPHPEHKTWPYLLRGVEAAYPNHIWGTDITYIRMGQGFVYLTAFMDWYSRYIVSWALSDTMEVDFILAALTEAMMVNVPEILNSDQGSQYTSEAYTNLVRQFGAKISMDGRGRCMDNIFTERFWRTLKQEEVYRIDYESPREARQRIGAFIKKYNEFRPHSSLGDRTPREVYFESRKK